MRQLREQMHSYQDRLARDFRAQCDQEEAELTGRIKVRAEKLEEAVSRPTNLALGVLAWLVWKGPRTWKVGMRKERTAKPNHVEACCRIFHSSHS